MTMPSDKLPPEIRTRILEIIRIERWDSFQDRSDALEEISLMSMRHAAREIVSNVLAVQSCGCAMKVREYASLAEETMLPEQELPAVTSASRQEALKPVLPSNGQASAPAHPVRDSAQYPASGSTEGLSMAAFCKWYEDYPDMPTMGHDSDVRYMACEAWFEAKLRALDSGPTSEEVKIAYRIGATNNATSYSEDTLAAAILRWAGKGARE